MLNVARTIFGSLGIAAFATLLDTFQKVNLANIIQSLSPNSMMATQFLSEIQVLLMQTGLTSQAAYNEAVIALYQYVTLRASVTAYDMNYVVGAIVVLLGVCTLNSPPASWENRKGRRYSRGCHLDSTANQHR